MASRRPHPSNGDAAVNKSSSSPPPAKKQKKSKASPFDMLNGWAKDFGCSLDDLVFARSMDSRDTLKEVRGEFLIPKMQDLPGVDLSLVNKPTEECIYMCGNSLGLQPKGVQKYLDNELKKWAQVGVHGHFSGDLPWALCDEKVCGDMAKLVGGKEKEVAVMNGLTVNLHLLMVSFYRPTAERHKILIEEHAFPSDHYAVESQIRLHGYDPETSLIQVKPKSDKETLELEDIVDVLRREGSSIALVLFTGVQYYTGQLFDIKTVTKVAHDQGCMVGWDLAHAVGNVPLKLNKWDVDFAVWCSYKYVNSGAGSVGGAFLHEKHDNNKFPKLMGWWGHRMETRFNMTNDNISSTTFNSLDPLTHSTNNNNTTTNLPYYLGPSSSSSSGSNGHSSGHSPGHSSKPCCGHHPVHMYNSELETSPGIAGYRLTNPSIMAIAPIRASLDIFNQTSIDRLRMKSKALTGYLEYLIKANFSKSSNSSTSPNGRATIEIITPEDPDERGAQLSLKFSSNIDNIFTELMKRGVCCDERKPDVLRIAPAPLYNNFEDVWRFNQALHDAINAAYEVEKIKDGSEVD